MSKVLLKAQVTIKYLQKEMLRRKIMKQLLPRNLATGDNRESNPMSYNLESPLAKERI